MSAARQPIREAMIAAFAVIAVLAVLSVLAAVNVLAESLYSAMIPLIFFWVPMGVLLARQRPLGEYGLRTDNLVGAVGAALAIAVVVLPLFTMGYWLFWGVLVGRDITWHLGSKFLWQIPIQFLVVAIPEELFFRGYLQTLLAKGWRGRKLPFVGTDAPAIITASVLFALTHVATNPHPARLGVFFPALLFGALRSYTGSIAAPVLLHALANLLIFALEGKV